MPNLNDQVRRIWDKTLHLGASDEARASFLKQVDADGDDKVTGEEIRKMADDNRDGFLSSPELERLAVKARASDFDQSTIKAMGQAANMRQLVLFTAEPLPKPEPVPEPVTAPESNSETTSDTPVEPGTAPPETPAPAETPPAPPPLRKWNAGEGIKTLEESFRTSLPYHEGALPSRELEPLKQIRAGLFRVQDQVGNSCGTTSLSMLLKYHQGHTLENSVPTIDKYSRAQGKLELNLPGGTKTVDIDGFTAARDIVEYAQNHGMRAGMKNNANTSELKAYLDKGVPLMVVTDWNFEGGSYTAPADAKPDGKSLHYVTLIGYEYQKNPKTDKQELHFIVGNPWGVVQKVSESDFKTVWKDLELEIPGGKKVKTGMNNLFIAMVPRSEEHPIVSPSGTTTPAGEIPLPDGSDGFKGWLAKQTSDVMQKTAAFQNNLGQRREQLRADLSAGYDQAGIQGAFRNLWSGDDKAIQTLRETSQRSSIDTKAQIVNQLMDKRINRDNIQQLTFDILNETPSGRDFDSLIDKVDARRLVTRLENDSHAGRMLARIGSSESERTGATGPKFESFATHLATQHRHQAIVEFLKDPETLKNKTVQKVPASLVKAAVIRLSEGITGQGEQKAIHSLLASTSMSQFDQVTSQLDMGRIAGEISDNRQLGELTARVIELGSRKGNWSGLSEILNQLSSLGSYGRADDVLATALSQPKAKEALSRIPVHLRTRMIDLLDDVSRMRSNEAVKALEALKKL